MEGQKIILIVLLVLFFTNDAFGQLEKEIREFIDQMISDVTSEGWPEKMKENFGWDDQTISDHQEFRDAFQNYSVEIEHFVCNGKEVVVWNKITAKFVHEYPYTELKGAVPTNEEISWIEVWYYEFADNARQIVQFKMLIDGVPRMKKLGIRCLSRDFMKN
ncbi:MAG: hypothetical protein JXQ65_11620 [Candidatus Marinimicrobia bacterium]|nr:hypothetical protein [Candidatus Neomarinimicrobiota bacterium]